MGNKALLVMDVQNTIVSRFAGDDDYLPRLSRAVDAARAADIPVIYVVVAFREGFPEVHHRNKGFGALKQNSPTGFTDRDVAVAEAVAPRDGEVVVTKRRVSAFAGSDLDVVLRAMDVDSMVLTGIATSGVVLSTIREAADQDFELTVLSDGCLDQDEEVHRVLTEKVFPRQADVTTIDAWIASVS